MGFLEVGSPLAWSESTNAQTLVKCHGVEQLLHIFSLNKDRLDAPLRWGEEIEYFLLDFDHASRSVFLLQNSDAVVDDLVKLESNLDVGNGVMGSGWRPEFSNSMVEGVPHPPYLSSLDDSLLVELSMRSRRCKIRRTMGPGKGVATITAFPLAGVGDFQTPHDAPDPDGKAFKSVFLPDSFICPHPRFSTLAANIRERRGAKVGILIPLFNDENTTVSYETPERDHVPDRFELDAMSRSNPNPVPGFIYMDAMGFGMGMCCLQATFETSSLADSRYLYDQFAVLAPLWLALSASTPFLRGLVADTDTRWSTISQSCDCRTVEEETEIGKSRYAGVSLYISNAPALTERVDELNDVNVKVNDDVFCRLLESGMDAVLARHFGYLFTRDPLVIFEEALLVDNTRNSMHFENIQSTNWNSVRLKPPPHSSDGVTPSAIGWRVEFRTPEVQMTDFENAAISCILNALARAIIDRKWDLYIPISKLDENERRSAQRNAVLEQKFFFRHDIRSNTCNTEYSEMTILEILFGKEEVGHTGIMTELESYIDSRFAEGLCSPAARALLKSYIEFHRGRADGSLPTPAKFLRSALGSHEDYKKDSIVPATFNYEMCKMAAEIGLNDNACESYNYPCRVPIFPHVSPIPESRTCPCSCPCTEMAEEVCGAGC